MKKPIKQTKSVPVIINYTYNNKRYEKKPDTDDLLIIDKINNLEISQGLDVFELPKGDKMGDPLGKGITHIHQFFTIRNLFSLLAFLNNSKHSRNKILVTAIASDVSKMARVKVGYYFKGGGGHLFPACQEHSMCQAYQWKNGLNLLVEIG